MNIHCLRAATLFFLLFVYGCSNSKFVAGKSGDSKSSASTTTVDSANSIAVTPVETPSSNNETNQSSNAITTNTKVTLEGSTTQIIEATSDAPLSEISEKTDGVPTEGSPDAQVLSGSSPQSTPQLFDLVYSMGGSVTNGAGNPPISISSLNCEGYNVYVSGIGKSSGGFHGGALFCSALGTIATQYSDLDSNFPRVRREFSSNFAKCEIGEGLSGFTDWKSDGTLSAILCSKISKTGLAWGGTETLGAVANLPLGGEIHCSKNAVLIGVGRDSNGVLNSFQCMDNIKLKK